MAWDPQRPVPWQRLVRDWLVYAALMSVVLAILRRDSLTIAPFLGLLVSGPIFITVGAILAKFGYQRKTMKGIRAEAVAKEQAKAAARSAASASTSATGRARPAPTKRTSGGSRRPSVNRRR
jgi:hypothetical protein